MNKIALLMIAITALFASCKKNPLPEFDIDSNEVTISVGDQKTIATKLLNSNDNIKWESADPSIAVVDNKGIVTGLKKGVTSIKATAANQTRECKVTVSAKILIAGRLGNSAVWQFDGDKVYDLTNQENGYKDVSNILTNGLDIYVVGPSGMWKNNVFSELPKVIHNGYEWQAEFRTAKMYSGDLYMLMMEKDGTSGAVVKNGTVERVIEDAYFEDIAVDGDNIYVVGYKEGSDLLYYATIWKNGVEQTLHSVADGIGHTIAGKINITNGNIYVAGYRDDLKAPVLWKNGVEQPVSLSNPGTVTGSYANDIFVTSEGDVYMVGYEVEGQFGQPDYGYYATLWKNGVPKRYSTVKSSFLHGICVYEGDVYVVGEQQARKRLSSGSTKGWRTGVYWKNDDKMFLDSNYSLSEITSSVNCITVMD